MTSHYTSSKKLTNFDEPTINKPIKKIDSAILDRIEKKNSQSTNIKIEKRSTLKELELQELEKIEKMSTFTKIKKLQYLLKEMITMKKTFEINKNKIIDKINENCFNYYKNKISMKEIYDYCQSKNLEDHISYILIKEPKIYLNEILQSLYEDICKFIFIFRNNNKMMIQLIDNCEQNDFDVLCDFLINFYYEDTINSSFIQEELMLIIYLIIEKHLMNELPKEILTNNSEYSYNIFRNEKHIIYHILKSLSRKADVRNFFCSILIDNINKLQGNRKYLSLDIFRPNNFEDEDIPSKNENLESNTISKSYSLRKSFILTKLKLSIYKEDANRLIRISTNINKTKQINIFHKCNTSEINEGENNKTINNKDNNNINNNDSINDDDNKNKDIYILPENIKEEDLNKIELEPFFDNNNVSINYIEKKMKEFEHFSKNNNVNLAIKDYLNSLIKDIKETKEEKYSNKKIVNFLKSIKIKMNEEEKNDNNNENKEKEKEKEESFENIIEMIKKNYIEITEVIDDIINKLKENITSVPVIIKCISNIIEQLLTKKYIEKKQKSLINYYQKYIFKSNFFIGNFLLLSLINPDYNGIYTSDIISKTTSENLKLIYNILDKLLSGELFTNDFEIFFNKYIIDTIPKIFEIIDNIEKNFNLPDVLQRLINTCTDINNEKRLNDFEYDFFYEKEEEMQYQSTCFNFKTLSLLLKLIKKIKNKIGNQEEKKLFEKIFHYENYFTDLYETDLKEKKCQYICLSRVNFNSKLENKINSMLRDNFIGLSQPQNENDISYFKKCLIEVLSYTNIINEEGFRLFTDNMKEPIHSYNINNLIYRKNYKLLCDSIINDNKEIINEERNIEDEILTFNDKLFEKIMEYLKFEIGKNIDNAKTQRIIFCTLFIQTHLKVIPKEYIKNNYSKLFMELIKETLAVLNFWKSDILNHLYNKIKEGNKLNLIITSNYMQIKNLEKFKIIEYLYSKILLPNKFDIEKDKNGVITKIKYVEEEKDNDEKKKKNNNDNTEKAIFDDFVIINKEEEKPEPKPKPKSKLKKELIKTLIQVIPDFRQYEKDNNDIIKLEEKCGMPVALKSYFKYLKKIVTNEKVVKRFNKRDIESISVDLENYILFKLYDKLYPTKPSKEDIKFYKKCKRLSFIKPENIITDKNIYNKQLWQISIDYFNDINNRFTPQDKIKTVLKSFSILQNSISFCSGKKELGVDDTIKPLIYILIKTKPINIFSNYNFCQLFLNDNLSKTQYGILLTQIIMIIRIIKDMKYNELIGVTEEEFGKDEEDI